MKKNKINDGHYVEALDRLNLIADMMERHLTDHPVIRKNKDIQKLIDFSIINIMEAYQRVGNIFYEKENENERPTISEVVLRRREKSKNRGVDRC